MKVYLQELCSNSDTFGYFTLLTLKTSNQVDSYIWTIKGYSKLAKLGISKPPLLNTAQIQLSGLSTKTEIMAPTRAQSTFCLINQHVHSFSQKYSKVRPQQKFTFPQKSFISKVLTMQGFKGNNCTAHF